MDIRGAGNLLGEEQSGHVREVGVELYQHMLEEAVATARSGANADPGAETGERWTPQINLGMPVLIPETYVADLAVRLGLYRRLADIADRAELDAFAAELIDRFGRLPTEVDNLLQVVAIKQLCRKASVERVDAGPKGAVLTFHKNNFAEPARLVAYLSKQSGTIKLRPDHKLICLRAWDNADVRLKGTLRLLKDLAEMIA
jgi:transcription-repair coupling factor (superfamily II helicase)